MKKSLLIGFIIFSFTGFVGNFDIVCAQTQKTVQTTKATVEKPIQTTALAIVADPQKYLNKTVKMQTTFDKFSALGLDYKKAYRPSS